MSLEIWASIPRHRHYEVSNHGRVRSLDRVVKRTNRWGIVALFKLKGRLLKFRRFPNGYLGVDLGTTGRGFLVHRLVAAAFVKRKRGANQVNHRDGVRFHNIDTNLEWVTCGENHAHSYAVLGRKHHALTRIVRVGCTVFPSINAAARHPGVTSGSVSSAARRNHRCGGQEISYV